MSNRPETVVDTRDRLRIPPPLDHGPNRHRKDRRFAVNQAARLSAPEADAPVSEARIRDISRRGMQLVADRPMPSPRVRIEWNGRELFAMVRHQQAEAQGFRMGVELSSASESLVSEVLAQQALDLETANAALRAQAEALQHTEERLGAYADTLAKHNEDLCAALDAARQANIVKSRFLASVSHELRTPLNGIIGFAQMLHDGTIGPVTDLQRECLNDMLSCSDHLLMLISHVLDLAKIESGKMTFQYEPVSLTRLIREAIDTLQTLAEAKRIAVEFLPDPRLDIVQADAGRLKQILYNYLSNALKFTGEAGRILVSVSMEGDDMYRIDVEDSGVGIAPGDLPRLFSEFGQLGAAEKSQLGSGLGLAITKRIAEAQGGRVGVSSELGAGSRFYVVLPLQPTDNS